MVRDGRDLAFKQHLTDDAGRRLGRILLDRLGARCHRLHFEELCRAPLPAMEAVADFLGVEMTGACRDYVAASVRPEKLGQHRSEDPTRVAEVEAVIAGTLAACGYPAEGR